MNTRAARIACALVLLPALAQAQAVNGTAEWTVSSGSSNSDGQPYSNNSFWQRYSVGWASSLLDPRLLKYDADVSFRTNSLEFGSPDALHHGRESDLGYRLGTVLFPARPFALAVQASRDSIGEAGDYPSSNGIRGGIAVPPGDPLPDFRTRNRSLSATWQLNVPNAPRIELGFRKSQSVVTGGPYRAEQRDTELRSGVFKETAHTRHALRYDRNSTESFISQALNYRLSDLSYEFAAMASRRSRVMVRGGRRTTFSLFDLPPTIVDPGTGANPLPSRGEVRNVYVMSGVAHQPASRLSLDLTGSLDWQDSARVATTAKLVSTSAQIEVVRGLSLTALGTYGERGEMVGAVPVTTLARSGQVGTSYRVGLRWVDASVGYSRGLGTSETPDGQVGDIRLWAGQANLSVSIRGVSLGGGYERSNGEDDILDFGNYDHQRQHLHLQTQGAGLLLVGSWDDSRQVRGRGALLARSRQQTLTASASCRLGRSGQLTANAGGFNYAAEFGRDRLRFVGGTYETALLRRLQLSVSIRREELTATATHLAQQSLGGYAQLDYRLRLFTFGVECHRNEQALQYTELRDSHRYRGNQLLLRMTRTFGLAF